MSELGSNSEFACAWFDRYTVELQWLKDLWLIYHSCFELVLESLGKNHLAADLGLFRLIFLKLKMAYCVFS